MATKTQLYGDLTLPAAIWSAGAFTHGVARASGLHLAATYTQTAEPTDVSVGSPVLIDWNPTLNNTNAPYGPNSATGLYGPRALVNIEGITQVGANQSIFSFTPVGFGDMHRVKNVVGANRNIVPGWVIMSARTTYADTNTVTIKGNDIADGTASFVDAQTFMTANSGTLDGTSDPYEMITMLSMPFLLGHSHVSKRTALKVLDMNQYLGTPGTDLSGQLASYVPGADAGIGTVDVQYGLEIPHLTQATTSIGIQNASATVLPGFAVTVAASITGVSTTVSTSLFNKTAHGLTNGTPVTVSGFVTTTGFSAATVYYVINALANSFQLSAAVGGGAYVPITMGGTNDSTVLTVNYALPISASRLLVTCSANTTLTSTPAMAAGLDGQEIEIVNVGSNTLILQDETQLTGSGFIIAPSAKRIGLTQRESITVRYSSTTTKWEKVSQSNPLSTLGGPRIFQNGVAANGWVTIDASTTADAAGVNVYNDTADTQPSARMWQATDVPSFELGPGGTTAPDVILQRTGAAAAAFTGVLTLTSGSLAITNASSESNLNVTDGTAAHGKTNLSVGALGGSLNIYGNSADTVPRAVLVVNQLQFGPGGAGAVDVRIQRTGTAALKILANSTDSLGVLGATPVTQQANTVDLGTVLSNFGFRVAGGNPALNLGSGALTAGTSTLGGTAVTGTITATSTITTSGGKIGYAAGTGGTVTQATSRTTGVTLNKPCGTITLFSTTLAADTDVSFVFTNSQIIATDTIIFNVISGAAVKGGYHIDANGFGSGSCTITVRNHTPTITATEAPVIAFSILRAVTT